MKKIVLIFLLVTVLVAVAILVFNRPEHSPDAASLLPETTLLFVDVPNIATSRAAFTQTPLNALWREPEVQAFFEKPLAALTGDNKNSNVSSLLQSEALTLPQGEGFLAVTRVTTSPKVQVGLVAGVDVKTKKIETQGFLKLYEHQLLQHNRDAKADHKTYLGTKYTIWQLNPANQVCHAFLGSMLVATLDEEQMRDMISRFTGHAEADSPSLAASPRYQRIIRNLPAPHDTHAFVNVEQLLSNFGMALLMAAQGSPALQAIANIQATATSVAINDAGMTDVGLISYSKEHTPDAPLQRRTLAVAPPDSALYAAQATDLAGGYTRLMELLVKSGNADAIRIGDNLDKFLSDAGVRLADDFLARLGPEVAYIGNWRQGTKSPDFALVVEVKDRAALNAKFDLIIAAIKKAVDSAGSMFATDDLQHAGETLHVVRIGGGFASPTYVLTEKYFILALTSDYARELVSQVKSGTTSLADAADFKNNMQRLPSSGASITYCDLRKVIGGIYVLAHANVKDSASGDIFQLGKLPQPQTIARHVTTYVSTTVEGKEVSTTTTFSSIGKPMTFVVALAGGLAAAQPLLAQLPPGLIPSWPMPSSSTGAPPPPAGDQTATSQTPPTR